MHRIARRNGQYITRDPADCQRHDASDRKPYKDCTNGNGEDLEHIDAEDNAAVGAIYLQRGNACAFAGKIAADAIADTDACNDECRQADQRQKLAHAFDKAPRSGCAV